MEQCFGGGTDGEATGMSIEALLFNTLRAWRDETARRQGVESYRIFPNATLEAIALAQPTSIGELKMIKGIKEVKSRLYGKDILNLVKKVLEETGEVVHSNTVIRDTGNTKLGSGVWNQAGEHSLVSNIKYPVSNIVSVSQFLDALNLELSGMAARIRGEVTSVDVRERVAYFTLKDKEDESVLNCLMFRYQYDVAGVQITVGDEIIVEGVPDIYKPSGRLSLRVESVEYAGEGALKKAYDELYKKLEAAGVFAVENKRPLPKFSERIALITSQEGAALGDFTMNLTRVGFRVTLYPTLVEGKRAVFEIKQAIEYFNQYPDQYDVLVMVRGGGSLESLQAFNTEALVQAVRGSKIPVLAGIGHERDVSLAALAADHMVSTPTATAKYLSQGWDEAKTTLNRERLFLEHLTEALVTDTRRQLEIRGELLRTGLDALLERVEVTQKRFEEKLVLLPQYFRNLDERLSQFFSLWELQLDGALDRTQAVLVTANEKMEQYNPARVLQLGYSLVRKNGKLLRQAREVRVGEHIDIQLGSGRIEGEVKQVVEG